MLYTNIFSGNIYQLSADTYSVLVLIHHVNVDDADEILEEYAASSFRVEVCRLVGFSACTALFSERMGGRGEQSGDWCFAWASTSSEWGHNAACTQKSTNLYNSTLKMEAVFISETCNNPKTESASIITMKAWSQYKFKYYMLKSRNKCLHYLLCLLHRAQDTVSNDCLFQGLLSSFISSPSCFFLYLWYILLLFILCLLCFYLSCPHSYFLLLSPMTLSFEYRPLQDYWFLFCFFSFLHPTSISSFYYIVFVLFHFTLFFSCTYFTSFVLCLFFFVSASVIWEQPFAGLLVPTTGQLLACIDL